jgi:hypothetical protein
LSINHTNLARRNARLRETPVNYGASLQNIMVRQRQDWASIEGRVVPKICVGLTFSPNGAEDDPEDGDFAIPRDALIQPMREAR